MFQYIVVRCVGRFSSLVRVVYSIQVFGVGVYCGCVCLALWDYVLVAVCVSVSVCVSVCVCVSVSVCVYLYVLPRTPRSACFPLFVSPFSLNPVSLSLALLDFVYYHSCLMPSTPPHSYSFS